MWQSDILWAQSTVEMQLVAADVGSDLGCAFALEINHKNNDKNTAMEVESRDIWILFLLYS